MKNPKRKNRKRGAAVRSSDMVRLLDECDAAMTGAAHHLWDINRDLALSLNKRAVACRIAIIDLQSNNQGEPQPPTTGVADGKNV